MNQITDQHESDTTAGNGGDYCNNCIGFIDCLCIDIHLGFIAQHRTTIHLVAPRDIPGCAPYNVHLPGALQGTQGGVRRALPQQPTQTSTAHTHTHARTMTSTDPHTASSHHTAPSAPRGALRPGFRRGGGERCLARAGSFAIILPSSRRQVPMARLSPPRQGGGRILVYHPLARYWGPRSEREPLD